MIDSYIASKLQNMGNMLSSKINEHTLNDLCHVNLKFHLTDRGSLKFQLYWQKLVFEHNYYDRKDDFFREFKQMYSLQGIDNDYLDFLEKNKQDIKTFFQNKDYFEIYKKYFSKAQIRRKNNTMGKELGSFYTKLLNSFDPNRFTALDNPIKNYFGFKSEGFFISYCIINEGYQQFIKTNKNLFVSMRNTFLQIDNQDKLKICSVPELKILDLIFWYEANEAVEKVKRNVHVR